MKKEEFYVLIFSRAALENEAAGLNIKAMETLKTEGTEEEEDTHY